MPALSLMQSAPGPEITIDGVRYLYFGGTSYLGLAANPEVIEAGCEALRRFGVHTATSRSRYGTNPPVLEVERRAAEFFGAEDAFYFSSGYMANHIMVTALAPGADCVLVDENAHYCVREAAQLAGLPTFQFKHGSAADLARQANGRKRILVLSDAVGPASGELAPVAEYLRVLAGCDRAVLLVDDAHGFGVLGQNGRGLLDELGLWPQVNRGLPELYMIRAGEESGTLAKALGGFGGIIPGTREFIAHLRGTSHYFDGASAPASAVAASTAKALEIVMREPALRFRLQKNTQLLRQGLRGMGLTVPQGATANFGVAIGDAANMRRVHEALKQQGILLPYINAYAGIPASGLLRFAVFANHSTDQIDRLLNELRALL